MKNFPEFLNRSRKSNRNMVYRHHMLILNITKPYKSWKSRILKFRTCKSKINRFKTNVNINRICMKLLEVIETFTQRTSLNQKI